MATYTVHEPPTPAADRADRADELRFVRDGFSWTTFLFPPLGLAMKKLWLPLIVYCAAVATVSAALTWAGANPGWHSLVYAALSLYLGYEISTIERAVLVRNGWTDVGTVTGRNIAECERRFFENWLPSQPIIAPSAKARLPEKTGWLAASKA